MKREYTAQIGHREFTVSNVKLSGDAVSFDVLGNSYTVTLQEKTRPIAAVGSSARLAAPSAAAARPSSTIAASASPNSLLAPISGIVVSVQIKEGSAVKLGEVLAVLEAMKMENPIKSDRVGVIKKILVQPGAQVRTGEALVEFE